MYNTIKLLVTYSLLLLFSCAPIPNEQFLKLDQIPESGISQNIQEAVEKGGSINISIGDTFLSRLSETDPILLLGKADIFRSHYKLFQFHAGKNEVYTVEVSGVSDSTGTEKDVLFPIAIIMDSQARFLKHHKMATYETVSSNISHSFRICYLQEIYTPNDGEYFILVASDNSIRHGNTVTTIDRETTLKYTLKGITGRRSPWGSFRLAIKSK